MLVRLIYTILFYLALPFILLRLLWKSRKNPGYRSRIAERFGYINKPIMPDGIWLHAVSLGESIAAIPLVKKLRQAYPSLPILITTTTPTGAALIEKTFSQQVIHCFSPYDVPDVLSRFLNKTKPRLLIVMETELWPNLFHACYKRNIPIFIANARLSERSAHGYKKIAALSKQMMQAVTLLAAQTQIEADRFVQLGLDSKKVSVTGSIKFDLEIPESLHLDAEKLRLQWGKDRLIWIAASTHESEETKILAAYAKIKAVVPNLLLVLVPRHPERFARVISLCKTQFSQVVLRSENSPCSPTTDIFIGDSMGELLLFYAASDLAFVGGSLVKVGGHNPLEPAALNLPVLMGPEIFNFADICKRLVDAKALIIVQNSDEIAQQVVTILQSNALRQQMGENGHQFVLQNRGALAKHLQQIEKILTQ